MVKMDCSRRYRLGVDARWNNLDGMSTDEVIYACSKGKAIHIYIPIKRISPRKLT